MLNFVQRVLANMAADWARRNAEQIEQAINATREVNPPKRSRSRLIWATGICIRYL